jgi:hypothetical protein
MDTSKYRSQNYSFNISSSAHMDAMNSGISTSFLSSLLTRYVYMFKNTTPDWQKYKTNILLAATGYNYYFHISINRPDPPKRVRDIGTFRIIPGVGSSIYVLLLFIKQTVIRDDIMNMSDTFIKEHNYTDFPVFAFQHSNESMRFTKSLSLYRLYLLLMDIIIKYGKIQAEL